MAVRRNYRINLRNYGNPPAIMVSQYDENYDLVFEVFDGVVPATGLNAYTVKLVGRQPGEDPTLKYEFTGTVSGMANNILSFTIDTTMTGKAGKGTAEIVILDTTNDVKFASLNLPVYVEKAAVPDDAIDADVERAQEIADEVQDIVDTAAAEVKGEAEAWAVGERDGEPVPSTDPTYHNNAKYYSEVAQDIADSIGIDATLSISGKAADAKKTGDDISELKEDLNSEIARAESEEARIEALFTGDVSEAVNDWLDEHPEATTTVQDGSLTEAKFSDVLKTKTVKDYITPQMFGAKGDGVADDTEALQSAVTYAIQNSLPLFVPSGTYMVYPATHGAILLSKLTAEGQGLVMRGAGVGNTIIKEGDGQTAQGGKYTRIFYCWLADPDAGDYNFGDYIISDMTIDKNARSNGTPESAYAWESAHSICFQGANNKTVKSITIERCEIVDKIGCGIAIGPSTTRVHKINIIDVISINNPTVSSGVIGAKGCIEVAIDSDLTNIDRCNVTYSQIELTSTYTPSANRYIRYNICNSVIKTLEYGSTYSDARPISYVYLNVSNVVCERKMQISGIHAQVVNCRFACTMPFSCPDLKIVNSTILLPYTETTDENTGTITGECAPLYAFIPSNLTDGSLKTVYIITGCDFVLDTDTIIAESITGYALRATLAKSGKAEAYLYISNCTFDKNIPQICDAYLRGGNYMFSNCKFGKKTSDTYLFVAGTYSSFHSSLQLINCDFSDVEDHKILYVKPATSDYQLKVEGSYSIDEWKQTSNNVLNVAQSNYISRPKLYGSTYPNAGIYFSGDIVINTDLQTNQCVGWICVAGGASGGTWKEIPFTS